MRRCAAFLVFLAVLLARPTSLSPALHRHREPERAVARREPSEYRELIMEATAYTHTGNRTATGTWPEVGTIAVDPEVIPLGTRLWVEGYGWGRAEDTGGMIKGKRVDVFLSSRAECLDWGRKRVRVRIYEGRQPVQRNRGNGFGPRASRDADRVAGGKRPVQAGRPCQALAGGEAVWRHQRN